MKLLYEGKAKRLCKTETAQELLMEFKAFDGGKKAPFGNEARSVVESVAIIKIEVGVRNVVSRDELAHLRSEAQHMNSTSRLRDKKMDKDRFRRDLGGVMEKGSEALKRTEHAADA